MAVETDTWTSHILDDIVLFVWDFNGGTGKRTELTARLTCEFEQAVLSQGVCSVLQRANYPDVSPLSAETAVRRLEHLPTEKLTTLRHHGANAAAFGVLDRGGTPDCTRLTIQVDSLDGVALAKQSALVFHQGEEEANLRGFVAAVRQLAQLVFDQGTVQDDLMTPSAWMAPREESRGRHSSTDQGLDGYDQSSELLFQNPRWRKYEESGNILYNLFRRRTHQELGEPWGFFGDHGNRTVADAGTAIWLCKYAPLLLRELSYRLSAQKDDRKLHRLNTSQLVVDILNILGTESRFLSDKTQRDLLARLAVSLGVGILDDTTKWQTVLRALFDLQFESSSGSGSEKPFMQWAIGIELDNPNLPLAARQKAFDVMYQEYPIDDSHLNYWAYLLLRLGLHLSATPMARRAAERCRDSASIDTYGWALFLEGDYGNAERHLSQSVRMVETGSEDWAEVQYHRVRNAVASQQVENARALLQDMKARAPASLWTEKAAKPKLLYEDIKTREFEYDVALSFAGEDRSYASQLAQLLHERGLTVFYDDYERAKIWGQDLYTYLTEVYQHRARFCVMLLSRHYSSSRWASLECRAAQARAFEENRPYILPVRIDNTEVPGVLPTVAYLSLAKDGVEAIVQLLLKKLAGED